MRRSQFTHHIHIGAPGRYAYGVPRTRTPRLTLRPMVESDWPQVRTIYLEGIATSQATFEITAPNYWRDWVKSKHEVGRTVAAATGDETELLGWTTLSPVSSRRAYAGVAELTIYVAARARGLGIGRVLLERLIVDAESAGIWTLQGVIFPENVGSKALHFAAGFREVGRREKVAKLNGAWRDTLLMERRSRLPELND